MKEQIDLPANYIVRYKDTNIVKLRVTPAAQVEITMPVDFPTAKLMLFLQHKQAWIDEKLALRNRQIALQKSKTATRRLTYLGEDYTYSLPDNKALKEYIKFDHEKKLVLSSYDLSNPIRQELWYKWAAHQYIVPRVTNFARKMGLSVGKVSITSAQKRFGSCSSKGNLCFTWRLIKLPDWIVDYVLFHELTHLSIFNHSEQFWAALRKVYPKSDAAQAWLKQHGWESMLD